MQIYPDGACLGVPCPSVQGLHCLALCNAEDAYLDLSGLASLQALCVRFEADGRVSADEVDAMDADDSDEDIPMWLCEDYAEILEVMQLDALPLSVMGLQVPHLKALEFVGLAQLL